MTDAVTQVKVLAEQQNKIENMTSEQGSQKQRILAFDLARGIAIVAMVVIHSVVFLGDPDLVKTLPGYIINSIVCLFAAPVFTFIMGVMIVFSSKSSTRTLLVRGCVLLFIGYLLNFLRGTLPTAFGEWAEWIDFQDLRPWVYMLEQDILQFAGVAFLVIALLKRVVPWNIGLGIMGCGIMIIAPVLYNIHLDESIAGFFISLFFGGNHYNFFPIVPWIAFPLAGMGYGELLKKCKDKKEFTRISLIVGALVILLGISLGYYFDYLLIQQWYSGKFRQGKLPAFVSIVFMGFQFILIPVCYYITENFKNIKILTLLYKWSSNVTWFYAIQWILIGWACVLLPYLSWWEVSVAIILVFVITDRVMLSFVKK